MSRRQVLVWPLVGAGALGLAGCAGRDDAAAPAGPSGSPTAPSRTPGTPAATSPPTGVTPSGPTPSGPATPALPTREEIVARYRSARPRAWSLTAPGVTLRLPAGRDVVALTFDACGGPTPHSSGCGYDRDLIDLLRRHRARATLFLNQRWIAANPGIAHELITDPLFEIGNHGARHLPLSVTGRSAYGERGTTGPGEVYDEIIGNRENLLALTGRVPRWFRPGTAYCDEVAVRIAADLGFGVAGFSVNGDAGTTFTRAQVSASLATARAGDIVISHVNRPEHQTAEGYRDGLPRLLDRGLRTVTLSEALA